MKLAKTYPTWVFDGSEIPDPLGAGERAVKFFGAIRHPLSPHPDKRFGLPPFWERIVRRIYGPRHPDGRRIVRNVFIMIPRGARKTSTVGGGLGLLHSIGAERVPTGQVFLAAGAEDQAELAFDEACNIVRATPGLKGVKIRGGYLEHPVDGSQLRVLSGTGDVALGTSPDALLLDELIAWKNRRLWRALKTGMVKRPGSLLVMTTTAGRGRAGLAHEEHEYACRIATNEIENESYLPIIFEPGEGADWQDEALWHQVCPGLRYGFPVIEEMRAEAAQVKDRPADCDDFKVFNLNFWLENALSPFVDMNIYDECGHDDEGNPVPVDLEALKSEKCWLAVDLSSSIDLSCIAAAWRDGEGYKVYCWFFCPLNNLEEREDKTGAPYREWVRLGLVEATPGNVIDFRFISAKIQELCKQYNVQEIAFDPALARSMLNEMAELGLPAVEHRQGSLSLMGPIAEVERAVFARRLHHGGHPILRFCFDNVEAEKNKLGHTVRLAKRKRWLSIDGCMATVMAVGRAFMQDEGKSKLFIEDAEAIAKMYGIKLEQETA